MLFILISRCKLCFTPFLGANYVLHLFKNVLFLTVDNEFSGIMYSLFGGRQNIFLTIFSNKFVIKCSAVVLKSG